jgi:hypothetical protein
MKFKGIKDNSTIKEIGSIYRRSGSSDWRLNIKLQPGQKKESFDISQLTALARRRVLNSTEELKPAGYEIRMTVIDATQWAHQRIGDCPIHSVAIQEDKDQWCFCFEDDQGVTYYLPQIELARVLFFHYGYLSCLAMTPDGLSEEFYIQEHERADYAEISILPTSSLPRYMRGSHKLRRLLAWILLDKEVRSSFESIARYQLMEGENVGNYRCWKFHFDPPALEGVLLTLRGHFDQSHRAFFVYEIHGVEHLHNNGPEQVVFCDPLFMPQEVGKGVGVKAAQMPLVQPVIDDDEAPSIESNEQVLQLPPVELSFVNPAHTNRKGIGSGHRHGGGLWTTDRTSEQNCVDIEVSTGEPTVRGKLSAAVFDAVEDLSDDLHHYTHRFKAFAEMVEILQAKGCLLLATEIRRLPAVIGYSKYLLADGNPRCLSFQLLSIRNQKFVLLEVDVSDKKGSLSTLLLKQPSVDFDWGTELPLLEKLLVQKSLAWPKDHLKKKFPGLHKLVNHQPTTSSNRVLSESHLVQRWADRVYNLMQ